MKAIELLMNSGHGVYIPQAFAQDCLVDPSDSENGWDFAENCAEVLLRGPDDDEYWEAWNYMLDSAAFRLEGGVWRLFQDGDLWAVNWDWMTIAERVAWRDTLGREHADLYELTGTADDREVIEQYMAAINMHPDDWAITEHGFHSLWVSVLDSYGAMAWRSPTFAADVQYDLAKACEFRMSQRARGV